MRIIFQNHPSGRQGPLTPYQRPLVLLLFLVLPLGLLVVVGSYLLTGEWFFDRFRYKKHTNAEVQHTTTETASTANDLLIAFHASLEELDDQALALFDDSHTWHDPDNEPAPKFINDFVYQSGDLEFLDKYNRIAFDRLRFKTKLEELVKKVDESVTELNLGSKADSVLKAERLVQMEIRSLVRELNITKKRFEEIATKYPKKKD